MILELNGKKVEYDFWEVDNFDKHKKAMERLKSIKNNNLEAPLEIIKEFSDATYVFFDTLFGEGAAENIFDGKHNLKICIECLKKYIEECGNYLANEFPKEVADIIATLEDLLS